MKAIFWAGAGTLFPFCMTVLGAALVFLIKKQTEDGPCMGFAAGVMSAAAVFSMLLPAMRQSGSGWLTVTAGFVLGAAMIAGVDALMRRVRRIQSATDETRRRLMMVAAITLHNIPEGMAVGLAFALASAQGGLAAAAVLALGIGVQNLPEGLAVALPFHAGGLSRGRSFALGALSGAVEPIFGMLAALMMGAVQSALPGMMAFCAGAMMQVVFAEMIPQAAKTRAGVVCLMVGYTLMMALDLALG